MLKEAIRVKAADRVCTAVVIVLNSAAVSGRPEAKL